MLFKKNLGILYKNEWVKDDKLIFGTVEKIILKFAYRKVQ